LIWVGLSFLNVDVSKLLLLYALILPISVVASIPGAVSHHLAFLNFFRLVALMGIFVGTVIVSGQQKGKNYLQYILFAFFLLCSITGIYEMICPVEMPLHWAGVEQAKVLPFRVSSFFVNPNLWGAFSAIMVSTLTAALLTEGNGDSVKKIAILLFVFAVNLGGTFSRGAWLSAIIGLFITFVLILIKKVHCPGKRNLVKFFLVGVIPLFLILYPSLSSRLSTLAKPGEFGMAQRLLLYKGCVNHVIDNFPLGSGAGSFQTLFPKYRVVGGQYVYEAHSDFLQFFAESGFPGFMGLIIFFGAILVFCAKRVAERSDCLPPFAFFITFLVAGNTVSFFHYSFLIVPILITGGLLLGNIRFYSEPLKSSEADFLGGNTPVPLKYLIIILSIGGFVYWGGMLSSEYFKLQAGISGPRNVGSIGRAIETLRKAAVLSPLRSDLYYFRGLYKMDLVKGYSEELETLSATAHQKKSLLILCRNQEYEEGLRYFHKAIILNSGESIYRQAIAKLHMAVKDFDKALESINDALMYDPCSVQMAYEKAVILDELEKSPESIEVLKTALTSNISFISINRAAFSPVLVKLTEFLKKNGQATEAREIQKEYGNLLELRQRRAINDR
jgi:O-antigen ligase